MAIEFQIRKAQETVIRTLEAFSQPIETHCYQSWLKYLPRGFVVVIEAHMHSFFSSKFN